VILKGKDIFIPVGCKGEGERRRKYGENRGKLAGGGNRDDAGALSGGGVSPQRHLFGRKKGKSKGEGRKKGPRPSQRKKEGCSIGKEGSIVRKESLACFLQEGKENFVR